MKPVPLSSGIDAILLLDIEASLRELRSMARAAGAESVVYLLELASLQARDVREGRQPKAFASDAGRPPVPAGMQAAERVLIDLAYALHDRGGRRDPSGEATLESSDVALALLERAQAALRPDDDRTRRLFESLREEVTRQPARG